MKGTSARYGEPWAVCTATTGDSVLTDRSHLLKEGLSHKAPQDKREIVMVCRISRGQGTVLHVC
jgi:hypothetical protein